MTTAGRVKRQPSGGGEVSPISTFGLPTPLGQDVFFDSGIQYMWMPKKTEAGAAIGASWAAQKKRAALLLQAQAHTWPFWRYIKTPPELGPDIARLESWAADFDQIYVLGTGGSSLGGQVLQGFCDYQGREGKKLIFLDNVDPGPFNTIKAAHSRQKLLKTGVLAISKSGATPETLAQLHFMMDVWAGTEAALGRHFLCVTEDKDSPMTRLCKKAGIGYLHHDKGLGGRFSILSNVGMLPGALMGFDVSSFSMESQAAVQSIESGNCLAPLAFSAAHDLLHSKSGIQESILMVYGDGWKGLPPWYCQLWGESLGKAGRGTTPVGAQGTQDQHSLLQLFLDGPKNKVYTVIVAKDYGASTALKSQDRALAYLDGASLNALFVAEAWATVRTLVEAGLPVRVLEVDAFHEKSLSQVMVAFMVETAVQAALWGIDAFNQPAVEQGKKLTKEFLLGR